MTVAAIHHILIDDDGAACIDGSRMKVIHLVKEMVARKLTVEQLRESFPHLSPAQVHAALAYYFDHKSELDALIAREERDFDAGRSQADATPGRQKLRDLGHRP